MNVIDNLKNRLLLRPSHSAPKPGNFHFLRQSGQGKKSLQLRIDEDGNGTLIVNAARVYHFNQTAAFMAFHLLNGMDTTSLHAELMRTFRVAKKQAETDLFTFQEKFEPLIDPLTDDCPICNLDLEVIEPFSKPPRLPYRMDLALTYRCNNSCLHCYNDPQRKADELDSAAWKQILDKLWQIGIPHVVFTGGEPTLRKDLPDLVQHAQRLGMVTGINTNGRRLSDPEFVEQLTAAGLDHVQITLESHDAAIHDAIVNHAGAWQQTTAGIRNVLASRLYMMTNTTLLKSNSASLEQTLQFLSELKVPTIGLNGLIYSGRGTTVGAGIREEELPALLTLAQSFTQTHAERLIWYTPTQYCHFDPVCQGLGVKGCTAAAYNMCVEPDGSVLPCQSYYQSLGNLLRNEWTSIWEHPLAVSIRNKEYLQEKCRGCNLLAECGGGCPLYLQGKPQETLHPMERAEA